ncbi:MAG: hypothetical protein K1Y36_10345 [Blastocatellia bacterium]|nr:hypothetical protein [Blastocatellia bacterium]HMW02732.1 hypothetical protein [Acidobacteriota bacterium]
MSKQIQVPQIGEDVLFFPHPSYGSDGAVPAKITRVHSLHCVNLVVWGLGTELNITSVVRADFPEQQDRWSYPPPPLFTSVEDFQPDEGPTSPMAQSEPEADTEADTVSVTPYPRKRKKKDE